MTTTEADNLTVNIISSNDCQVSLYENVFSSDADSLLKELSTSLPWKVEQDNFGEQSRATCYFGDPECVFTYVGLRLEPRSWPKVLLSIRETIAQACEGIDASQLTACLANHYPKGQGHIPWHYDEVRAHGPDKIVVSVSLGGPRRFQLRSRHNSSDVIFDQQLPSGSVLVMKGATQEHYEHCLPLESDNDPHRVSLTFRSIVPGFEQNRDIAVDDCCIRKMPYRKDNSS